jgi:hypothetical protein
MSETDRKFYRNTFTLVILSEHEPLTNVDLDNLGYLVSEGPCVLHSFMEADEQIDSKQMADLLTDAGSMPDFFQLDRDGNDTDEWEEA